MAEFETLSDRAIVQALSVLIVHGQIGVTTVGAVRTAGGDVIRTSGRSPYHATLTGLISDEVSVLLTSTIPNPSELKE